MITPLQSIRAAKERGIEDVLVAFSGGKDSLCILDLCCKHFRRAVPYFLFWIKNLSFQEKTLRYCEGRYNLQILRYPHAFLSQFYMRLGLPA